MGKAVLISIRPEWCDRIARGEKTLEVRKSRPKLETPFKCYIYRSKGKVKHIVNGKWVDMPVGGDVIGEFICDTFVVDKTFGHDPLFNGAACMSEVECAVYSCRSQLYGWHISNLKIYDRPKRITQFKGMCRLKNSCFGCTDWNYQMADCNGRTITRPPQSWCYVEG